MENIETTKQLVMDAVAEIQAVKQEAGKNPDMASFEEIVTCVRIEILEALRALYREGKIVFSKTVNGRQMFGIKPDEPTDKT